MIALLQDMQTYCVGRYQIDLPRGSRLIHSENSAGGDANTTFYTDLPIGHQPFEYQLQQRWRELLELKPRSGQTFIKPSDRLTLSNGGTIFTSRHREAYQDEWPDGSKGLQYFYEVEGYLWKNEISYVFKGDNQKEETIKAMERLIPMDNTTIPVKQGLCTGQSFFPGPPTIGENTILAFRLPDKEETEIRIYIPYDDPMRPNYFILEHSGLKITKLRNANRNIATLKGEEWGYMAIDAQNVNTGESIIRLTWFHQGKGYNYLDPGLQIILEKHTPADDEFASGNGTQPTHTTHDSASLNEFMTLWDGIIETFRPRPGAF